MSSIYIDLIETTSTYLYFCLAAFTASCSASNELSVSASWISSCIFPSNSFPTRSVTLSLGVNDFAAFFLGEGVDTGLVKTTSGAGCGVGGAGTSSGSVAPNNARRISSSVKSELMEDLKGALIISTSSIRIVADRYRRGACLDVKSPVRFQYRSPVRLAKAAPLAGW